MSTPKDDLEAVREICNILSPFSSEEQGRVIRWTLEKLNLNNHIAPTIAQASASGVTNQTDIKSFIDSKKPQSDMHFATAVVYYYKFQAPAGERKNEISSDDLQEACRQANQPRLANPNKTLNNALGAGLLNKGSAKGSFIINSVGENLVAMSLPMTGKVIVKKKKSKK